ncbi:MAG: cupin domain-containing protein [Flavipsychrobacter sp.]
MSDKHNDATLNRPEGDRDIDANLIKMDLNKYISQIKSEEAWLNKDRNAITLYKTDTMRMVLLGLHQDAELKEHTAPGNISVHLLEGHVSFRAEGQEVKLTAGQIVTLHAKIPHSVFAHEESVFLLTISVNAS